MTIAPPPPSDARPQPAPPRTRASSRLVAIVVIVVGTLVILFALAWGVSAAVLQASTRTETRTLAVDGVTELEVDVSAGSLRIEYADVAQAELEVRSAFGLDAWTFERDEDELAVASPRWLFGGAWPWLLGGETEGVLRLPLALAGADADLGLGAGELTVEGDFGELSLEVGAGRVAVEGTARELSAEISAGGAELDLDDVRSAELRVSAGSLDVSLGGSAPRQVQADVSAGSLRLAVPVADYDITSEVSAGGFDNRIGTRTGAAARIHVEVSAGTAVLEHSTR